MTVFIILALTAFASCVSTYPTFVLVPVEDLERYGLVSEEHRPRSRSLSMEGESSGRRRSELINFDPERLNVEPETLNVNPDLLNFDPESVNVRPENRPRTGSISRDDYLPSLIQEDSRPKRQSAYGHHGGGGGDHVDYGAYTGGKGAFGWYSDHPVLLGPH